MSLAFWCKLKNPSFSNPSFPESTSPRATGTKPSLCRFEDEEERRGRERQREEEDGMQKLPLFTKFIYY